jgi:hypothetical protein
MENRETPAGKAESTRPRRTQSEEAKIQEDVRLKLARPVPTSNYPTSCRAAESGLFSLPPSLLNQNGPLSQLQVFKISEISKISNKF